jgi:hypothetical protein
MVRLEWLDAGDIAEVPGGRLHQEGRQVVNKVRIGEERGVPVPRYPCVIDIIGVGAILGFSARRAGDVVEECRIDSMATEPQVRGFPATAVSENMLSMNPTFCGVSTCPPPTTNRYRVLFTGECAASPNG